ncbi:MAG TPA: Hsp20/alpha crystallin family protein [Chloroflexia bacterium]|nr:Hsp20/alpha crystallin family protein [Chloroflexia bacterium]
MTVQRWDPWTEMLTLREAMGRLLEDSYVRPAGASPTAESLPLDVYEDADNIEVSATLPGLRPEDVEITLQGDMLTIKGQRKTSTERKQGNYLMREQRSGNFYRSIQLPVLIDAGKVQANFEHGLLHLTLPKAEATKPRKIQISAGASSGQPQQLQVGQKPSQGNGQNAPAASETAGMPSK